MLLRFILSLRCLLPKSLYQKVIRTFWEKVWKEEEIIEKVKCGRPISISPVSGSERAVLCEAVCEYYPFKNVLEIGCGIGPNFDTISKYFPHSTFVGVDSDLESVTLGQSYFLNKLQNVNIVQGDACDLSRFENKSFDIVISSAFMLFVPPEKMEKVLSEMLRLAKTAIVIMEQHKEAEDEDSSFILRADLNSGYWIHDYRKYLLSLGVSDSNIKITPVPSPRWELERWQSLATLIEVKV